MKRYRLLIGATAAAFALSVLPVDAQRPGGGGQGGGGSERGGSGPGSGGGGGGSGPAGGGGGGGGSSSGGGGGSSSGGGGGSMSSPSSGGGSIDRPSAAPRNPNAGASRRSGGGGDRAVPRGTASNGAESRGAGRVSSAASSGSSERVTQPADRAVPAYSRPREGRPVTGTAVDRQTPIVRGGRDLYPYYSYFSPRYYWPGYGFGLGFYSYDPFWFDPYYDPYYGGGAGYYGGSGGYGYGSSAYRDAGSLRLKIKPREAKVYVDGYFVGDVDSFDGIFQKLGLDAGGHQVEIRADGYEPLQFEVLITPGESVTYKGELKRIQ